MIVLDFTQSQGFIPDFINKMVKLAKKKKEAVAGEINNIGLVANLGDTVKEVSKQYTRAYGKRFKKNRGI